MNEKIEISKIEIKIGEQTIILTLEQVQELMDTLNAALFNKANTIEYPSCKVYCPNNKTSNVRPFQIWYQ